MILSGSPRRRRVLAAAAAGVAGATAIGIGVGHASPPTGPATATPIKHLVVVFQENVSFDHYFGTYPKAANTDGSTFTAAPGTPSVNGLSDTLLDHNPNSVQPQRLSPSQALTCDQDHGYKAEQEAADHGAMDKFVEFTSRDACTPPAYGRTGLVMDYYDGNTVTGLWNYAQHFAMNDNSYGTTFGPSTPGALNLISGQTGDAYAVTPTGQRTTDAYAVPNQTTVDGTGAVINDPDPAFDTCSNPKYNRAALTGRNVGDLLNDQGVTWGWFEGGFADCAASHQIGTATPNQKAGRTADYIPHHEPFQYYRSTANPDHTPPASVAEIGHAGAANHQYDLSWFSKALDAGNLPAVSFVKAPAYQDGHAGYSDPLDEQRFLVSLTNEIQKSKEWKDTAIVVNYDDSDGWYDHQLAPVVNHSQGAADALTAPGECGPGGPELVGQDYRCGYGPRLPLLVISPFAKTNYVDSTLTDQSSILRFVEDNWLGGKRIANSFDSLAGPLTGMLDFSKPAAKALFLDPATGQPTDGRGDGHGRGGDH